MLIFDAHLDLALNAVDWNRDLRMSVEAIRAQETTLGMTSPGRRFNTVTFPELRKAGVGVGLATVLARLEPAIDHTFGHSTPEACYAVASAHLAYYRAMERAGAMRMIRTRRDLLAHVEAWKTDAGPVPFGFILSMECADPILEPDQIDEWYAFGLRAIGITHYGANRYGGGTNSEVGLAVDALPLLRRIEELGIALDLTHLSDRAFRQVVDLFGGRVLASHQNVRSLCDWQRQFTDDQIRHVIARDGVLGLAFDAIMLQPGWVRGVSKPVVTIKKALDHVDHICQLAGSARHVGIGSDLDGGFGRDQAPVDLDTIADLQTIPDLLAGRNYADADIRAFMHGNWLRFFGEVLPE